MINEQQTSTIKTEYFATLKTINVFKKCRALSLFWTREVPKLCGDFSNSNFRFKLCQQRVDFGSEAERRVSIEELEKVTHLIINLFCRFQN